MIYFILNKAAAAIKVGYSADPSARLVGLRTASADELEFLGAIEGDKAREAEIHADLADWRRRGEWFSAEPELMEHVNSWLSSSAFVAIPGELTCRKPVEAGAYCILVRMLKDHGYLAFSIRGPLGEKVDDRIKNLVWALWRSSGPEAMNRVYDAVEAAALRMFNESEATYAMYALDHRFDGIGGWHC